MQIRARRTMERRRMRRRQRLSATIRQSRQNLTRPISVAHFVPRRQGLGPPIHMFHYNRPMSLF